MLFENCKEKKKEKKEIQTVVAHAFNLGTCEAEKGKSL